MEKKLRIYIETSVISHLDAPLKKCHEPKRTFMLDALEEIQYDSVGITRESERLASRYIEFGGLPGKSWADATHIALATLTHCNAIVSWNFSHIVNLKAMTAVDTVNTFEGVKLIRIVSPTILLGGQIT